MNRLGFYPVDIDGELRRAGTERRHHPLDARLSEGIARNRIDLGLKFREVEACIAQFDLHGDAGGISDALDRRRRQNQDASLLDLIERLVEAKKKRTQILALAALAPIIEDDISDAAIGQWRAVVEGRYAGDGDDLAYPRSFPRNLRDPVKHLLRALGRSAIRQLHACQQISLVLDRQKAGRDARETVEGNDDDCDRERSM